MKCFICTADSVSAERILCSYPMFKACDFIKREPSGKNYDQLYLEGDDDFIFQKIREIAKTVRHDVILHFHANGNMNVTIYDDYIE